MSGVIPEMLFSAPPRSAEADALIAQATALYAAQIAATGAKCDALWPPTPRQAQDLASWRATVAKHEGATAVACDPSLPEDVRDAAAYTANWSYSNQAIWQVECEKKWAADPDSHPSVRMAVDAAAKAAERARKDAENDAYWAEYNSAEAVAERERDRLAILAEDRRWSENQSSSATILNPEDEIDVAETPEERAAAMARFEADVARRMTVPAGAPTLAMWKSMTESERSPWRCYNCERPALEGSYDFGSLCSMRCAIIFKDKCAEPDEDELERRAEAMRDPSSPWMRGRCDR